MSFDPITAGIDLVKDVGGKLVDHFFPDPEQAAKAQMELAKLTQDGKIQTWVQENERFKNEVDDRKSAREREMQVATSPDTPYLNKIILPVLAIGTILLSFILFYFVFFDNDMVTPRNKDVIIYILGVLSAIDTQIIQYYFGSSSGSTQTRSFLENMIQK